MCLYCSLKMCMNIHCWLPLLSITFLGTKFSVGWPNIGTQVNENICPPRRFEYMSTELAAKHISHCAAIYMMKVSYDGSPILPVS